MNYTHLSQTERYQIYILKKAGHNQQTIAVMLKRSISTISRELRRNRGQCGYRPKQAHALACRRRADNAYKIDSAIWREAQKRLKEQWSPEQISSQLAISHETLYQRIYADKKQGGTLWQHLRCQKKRKKRYGKNDRRGVIPNRQSIDQRPAIVDAGILS